FRRLHLPVWGRPVAWPGAVGVAAGAAPRPRVSGLRAVQHGGKIGRTEDAMDLKKWDGLRVVVASRRLYPANGGGELSLLAIARHLEAQGAAVTLSFHGGSPVPGFACHPLPEPVRAPG